MPESFFFVSALPAAAALVFPEASAVAAAAVIAAFRLRPYRMAREISIFVLISFRILLCS